MPVIHPDNEHAMHLLARAVRAAVAESGVYVVNRSCILTVRIGIEVGRYYGLRIEPLPVGDASFTDEWSVGTTGSGALNGNDWDAHLVGVAARRWLIDFAADQRSRPAKGMPVPHPVVVPYQPHRVNTAEGDTWLDTDTGVYHNWRAYTGTAAAWRHSPNWRHKDHHYTRTCAAAIARLRTDLQKDQTTT